MGRRADTDGARISAADLRAAHDSSFTDLPRDRAQWSPYVGDNSPRGRHRDPAAQRAGRIQFPRRALVVLAVVALLAGVAMVVVGSRGQERVPHAAPLPTTQFSVAPNHIPPAPTDAPSKGSKSGKPKVCHTKPSTDHVVIARICVDAEIHPTTRESNGDLVIPSDVQHVGLWGQPIVTTVASRRTVGTTGTTLIAGHIDDLNQGAGAFYAIGEAQPGDVVYATDAQGHTVRWRVISLRVVKKAALPESVFNGPTGPRRLVLVTCGGPIVYSSYGNYYEDNVVVTAVPG